ncbi:MAG: hypothetical protein AB7G37_20165, partial [Solirubrobacteraceae bacterium]
TEELMGALNVLGARARSGLITEAWLRIQPRSTRRPYVDESGETKTEVSRFIVPVIDVEQTIPELMSGEGPRLALPTPTARPALGPGAPPPPTTPLRGGHVEPVRGHVVDDAPPLPPTAPPPPRGEAARRPKPEDMPIDADARRALFTLKDELGLTDTELRLVCRQETGQENTGAITVGKLERVRAALHERVGRLPTGDPPPPTGRAEDPHG